MLILVAYLLTCVTIWTGPYFQSALTVSVGDVSPRRVVATRRVENTLATERNRAEAEARAADLRDVTRYDPAIDEQVYAEVYALFDRLAAIRLEYDLWLYEQEEARQQAYEEWQQAHITWQETHTLWEQRPESEEVDLQEPIRPDEEFVYEIAEFPTEERFDDLPVRFNPGLQEFILTLSEGEYEELYYAVLWTAEAVLEPGIEVIDFLVQSATHNKLMELMYHSDAIEVGYQIVLAALIPNLVFHPEGDEMVRQQERENYDPVFLLPNQIIVDENEPITEDAYAIMESLGLLETEWTRDIIPLIGIFIVVAVTMLACCWFIFFYRQRIIPRTKESLLIFILYVGMMIVLWALNGIDYYFMPILVFTMLIAMLKDLRTAVILNLGITVVAYFVVDGTIQYLIFFMLSGSLICLLARYTTERSKILMVGLLAACFNFIITVGITLAFEPHQAVYSMQTIISTGAFSALNGMFTVIIAVGSLPLWEALFGVVTPIKLLDLTNPTNPLMRRLTLEAPGTYHHSLIVANMAESAAYDIGANPHIARAGGYYHDIGKLEQPHYFMENITGVNPHDSMDPLNSAEIITGHITNGMALAAEYRLPQFLKDIIQEHHGTTLIRYFYCKAKETENPDDPQTEVKESDYRYPFIIPQSRESAVVMLADGIEAAVRAVMAKGTDIGSIQELINKMIRDKLTDGSLADSKLSIRDVDTIAQSFYRVLKGMYHERIPYPQDPQAFSVLGGEPLTDTGVRTGDVE